MIDELALGAVPFRGSAAVSRGMLTTSVLHGHRYRRLFHDIYLLASAPADLTARSQAAALLVPGQGVLSGYSAADLLGARCAPAQANAELTIPGGDLREQPGLTGHRDLLADDEITDVSPRGMPARLGCQASQRSGCRWLVRAALHRLGRPPQPKRHGRPSSRRHPAPLTASPDVNQIGSRRKIGRGTWRSTDMM